MVHVGGIEPLDCHPAYFKVNGFTDHRREQRALRYNKCSYSYYNHLDTKIYIVSNNAGAATTWGHFRYPNRRR
jgi:hypothetical protein